MLKKLQISHTPITAFSQDDLLLLLLLLSHILTATPAPQVDDQTNLAEEDDHKQGSHESSL